MADYDYKVSARLYFIPAEERDPNPETTVVVVRKVLLTNRSSGTIFRPAHIRCTQFVRSYPQPGDTEGVRQTEKRYCFSAMVEPKKDLWPMLKLRPDPPIKWKKIDTFNEEGAIAYLAELIGSSRAVEAMHELITKKPTRAG